MRSNCVNKECSLKDTCARFDSKWESFQPVISPVNSGEDCSLYQSKEVNDEESKEK